MFCVCGWMWDLFNVKLKGDCKMSSFVVSKETLELLSSFLYQSAVSSNSLYMDSEIKNAFEIECEKSWVLIYEKDIYKHLNKMNIDAYCQRYKDEKPEYIIPENLEFPMIPFPRYNAEYHIEEYPLIYWQILKSLQCYIYQCEEGNISEKELFKMLKNLCNRLKDYMISNTVEYSTSKWG